VPENPPADAPAPNHFSQQLDKLRAQVSLANPSRLAKNTGSSYFPMTTRTGEFRLLYWEQETTISFPDLIAYNKLSGDKLSVIDQAMLLYYFKTADGAPICERWISFSELLDGTFYNQAFQGYTGHTLARVFQNDQASFEHDSNILSGTHYELGDAAYVFQALPQVALLVVFWLGDEDFPSSFQIVFDASASNYLPTDAYAIMGSMLTRRLIKEKDISR